MHVLTCNLIFAAIAYITELNKLIKKLDRRAQESKFGGFQSKVRVLSTPSTLLPPPNPPAWSIIKECLQTSTPTTGSNIETQSSSTTSTSNYTPVSMPRSIVQRRLSMSDSSLSTAVQSTVTINDNSVTTYVSPTHFPQEDDGDVEDEDTDAESDNDSSSCSSSD